MTERAMVFETCRLGVEATATPGTAVLATKILSSMSIAVTPNPENKTYTPKGFKFPTANVPIREWTDMKIDGIGTYNELVYPMSSALTDPVIATPGGGTLSRTWTYALLDSAPDTQRTFSLEFGTETQRAWHTQNALLSGMGLVFNRKDVVKLSGEAFGQAGLDDKVRWLKVGGTASGGTFAITVGANTTAAIAYDATAGTIQTAIAGLASVGAGNVSCTGGPINTTPVRIKFQGTLNTATGPTLPSPISVDGALLTGVSPTIALTRLSPGATQLDLIPISPTTIDVKTAATQAGLTAAGVLSRNFQYTWKIGGRDNMVWPLASANGAGFGATVEALPKGEASLDVAANDAGMGYLANIRTGNTLFVRVAATGPLIEGAIYHALQIDTAINVMKISEFKDIDGGLLGVTFSGEWCHDPTWGYATTAVLTNTLTAL